MILLFALCCNVLDWDQIWFSTVLSSIEVSSSSLSALFPVSWFICACALSCFCHVGLLCGTPWTVAHKVPSSMGFFRQEYWSELPCPSPGDLPDPGIKAASLTSPALVGGFFTTSATWEAHVICMHTYINQILKN